MGLTSDFVRAPTRKRLHGVGSRHFGCAHLVPWVRRRVLPCPTSQAIAIPGTATSIVLTDHPTAVRRAAQLLCPMSHSAMSIPLMAWVKLHLARARTWRGGASRSLFSGSSGFSFSQWGASTSTAAADQIVVTGNAAVSSQSFVGVHGRPGCARHHPDRSPRSNRLSRRARCKPARLGSRESSTEVLSTLLSRLRSFENSVQSHRGLNALSVRKHRRRERRPLPLWPWTCRPGLP